MTAAPAGEHEDLLNSAVHQTPTLITEITLATAHIPKLTDAPDQEAVEEEAAEEEEWTRGEAQTGKPDGAPDHDEEEEEEEPEEGRGVVRGKRRRN